jgi:hypothetical protein
MSPRNSFTNRSRSIASALLLGALAGCGAHNQHSSLPSPASPPAATDAGPAAPGKVAWKSVRCPNGERPTLTPWEGKEHMATLRCPSGGKPIVEVRWKDPDPNGTAHPAEIIEEP